MRVISNSAISVDGRLHTAEERPPMLGSRRDLQRMRSLRAQADAVLVGGATFRRWPIPALPEDDALAARSRPFWNVVVSRRLDIVPRPAFLQESRIRKLFLTTPGYRPPDCAAELEVFPDKDIPIKWILDVLARRGIGTLLVEAGGDLLSQFLAADALDELFVTLCPLLIGGDLRSGLLTGAGLPTQRIQRLNLKSVEQIEDELFLHYVIRKQ